MAADTEIAILPRWFETTLGQYLIQQETDLFKRLLPDQYYQVVVQTGISDQHFLTDLHADLRISIITGLKFTAINRH